MIFVDVNNTIKAIYHSESEFQDVIFNPLKKRFRRLVWSNLKSGENSPLQKGKDKQ